ncbi:hypothetical protein [Methylocapsa palsarum]|uniref:Uncharacterized protein n=1 Tax=Methylocapsa palsarum TaxID=1612308 RepID=A0A1I3VPY0_9HYPH|nr:hypothetical protein [Methylocapsa palsarum]SFJ97179.1 hypothetical protein SAMN05444581_1014 [Methylocapsa palsarum]
MPLLRLALLALAALVAVILGYGYFFARPSGPPPQAAAIGRASPQAVAAVRRLLDADYVATAEFAPFFERFKIAYPAEYEASLAAFSERSAAAGEIGSPDLLVSDAARALRQSRGVLAAKAGGPALDHIFEVQLAMLRTLSLVNPRLCANYLFGGESADFLNFSASHRKLVATMAMAGLDAIKDGAINRISRARPAPQDFQALEEGLRAKGLGTPEIEALLDGKADPSLDDEKMCRAGGTYLETLATLPEEPRRRIYGLAIELMARS